MKVLYKFWSLENNVSNPAGLWLLSEPFFLAFDNLSRMFWVLDMPNTCLYFKAQPVVTSSIALSWWTFPSPSLYCSCSVLDCELLKGGLGWTKSNPCPHPPAQVRHRASHVVETISSRVISWDSLIVIMLDPECYQPTTGCDCWGFRSVTSHVLQSRRLAIKNWVFGIS